MVIIDKMRWVELRLVDVLFGSLAQAEIHRSPELVLALALAAWSQLSCLIRSFLGKAIWFGILLDPQYEHVRQRPDPPVSSCLSHQS